MTIVRVLLVDSSDDFLDGLSAWLGSESGIEIVGTARTGIEAVEKVAQLKPDLVVMDICMSLMNGFQATREIKAGGQTPRVLLTTFHASETARSEARAAGADALIAKADVTTNLRDLIDGLLSGNKSINGSGSQSSRRETRRKEKGV